MKYVIIGQWSVDNTNSPILRRRQLRDVNVGILLTIFYNRNKQFSRLKKSWKTESGKVLTTGITLAAGVIFVFIGSSGMR